MPVIAHANEVAESFVVRKKEAATADFIGKLADLKEVAYGMLDGTDWRGKVEGGRNGSFETVIATARETILKQKGLKRLLEALAGGTAHRHHHHHH